MPLEEADTSHSKQAARPVNGSYFRDCICGPQLPSPAAPVLQLCLFPRTHASAQLGTQGTVPGV